MAIVPPQVYNRMLRSDPLTWSAGFERWLIYLKSFNCWSDDPKNFPKWLIISQSIFLINLVKDTMLVQIVVCGVIVIVVGVLVLIGKIIVKKEKKPQTEKIRAKGMWRPSCLKHKRNWTIASGIRVFSIHYAKARPINTPSAWKTGIWFGITWS